MKILIIEDEILIQKSIQKILERQGHDVDVASNGSDSLALISNSHYDKILCDLMLNDISGFDIIEECKTYQLSKSISQLFIIMTAYSSQTVLEKASSYGCKVFNKPFKDINQTLQQMLS